MHTNDETHSHPDAPPEAPLDASTVSGGPRADDPDTTRPRAADADPAATRVGSSAAVRVSVPGAPTIPGYELTREIARGGMGVVYAAVDLAFRRDVAVKVMLPGMSAAEFVREATITARLPHPGIPPVHAMGELPDGRPFLAMKLIKGDTLDRLLKTRQSETTDRPKLLAAFEAICQAVGYAHAQGIIHRDLKPSNVMVGAFGEVQVMDWGLAKELAGGAESPHERPLSPAAEQADTRDAAASVAGAIKGTPAYMAPEQARGEVVDERADVFALGGILTAVLTGKPPFVGNSVTDAVTRAARADLADAFGRLDASGADAELINLAKQCLAGRRGDRPANGSAVASAVAEYRAGVEERLRRAERERAAAEAKAVEQRKRRRVQLALATAVVLLVGAGAGFAWWRDKKASELEAADERTALEAGFKARQARQGIDDALKLSIDLRKWYRFGEADAALAQALKLADGAPERRGEVEQARRDLAFVVKLDDIRFRKWAWTTDARGKVGLAPKVAGPEYQAAFARFGIDPVTGPPAEAAARVAASGVKTELVAALDDWALYTDPALRARLLEVARRADPGPWADRMRDPAVRADPAAVARLAADADVPRLAPALLSTLAELMERHALDPGPVLAAARAARPNEFELAFLLGLWLGRGAGGKAVGPLEAARALRPDSPTVLNNLGAALQAAGDLDGAVAVLRRALALDPGSAAAHTNLGNALRDKGDQDGAAAAFGRALELRPDDADMHSNFGTALREKGDVAGAVRAFRRALELNPKLAMAWFNLGNALRDQGDAGGAIAAYKQALDSDSGYAAAAYNLGLVLWDRGDAEAAGAAFRRTTALDPKHLAAHNNLSAVLRAKGDPDGSIAACKRALALDPTLALPHINIGLALGDKGDWDGAVVAYNRALALDPNLAQAHTNLGVICLQQKKYAECITHAKAAIKVDPKYSFAHVALGLALREVGDLGGARAALTEATRLDKRWAAELAKLLPPPPVAPAPREVPARDPRP